MPLSEELLMKISTTFLIVLAASICCHASDVKTKKTEKQKSEKPAVKEKIKTNVESKPVKLDPDGESHPPSVWMQQKLKHSQKIFAGLVVGDLIAVEESARHLQFINRLENFVRGQSKGYRTQLRQFQYANDEIVKGAKDRNLDRVTLGYSQLALSCVACHKQLRVGE